MNHAFVASVVLALSCAATGPASERVGLAAPTTADIEIQDVDKEFRRAWPPESSKTGLAASVKKANIGVRGYGEFRLDVTPGRPHAVTISVMRRGTAVYSWKGHEQSEFDSVGGETLYYVDFSPDAPGAVVIAVDLKSGRAIWQLKLEDIPGNHAAKPYHNAIGLVDSGTYLVVSRDETDGGYLEFIDVKVPHPRIYRHHLFLPNHDK